MLLSINSGKRIKTLPHAKEFSHWKSHISDADYLKIINAINKKIDSNTINTAGWIPGNNWTGTVFEPLYYACGKNKKHSGMFFGLIVFNTLMNRDDKTWGFYKSSAIKSMTYFEIPPALCG